MDVKEVHTMANIVQRKRLFLVGCLFLFFSKVSPSPTYAMETCSAEHRTVLSVCQLISQRISSASQVFYPFDLGYNETIDHYASSSTQLSTCGVQPGSVADVAIILKILGQYRVPFAVKGGGHATNPGFSSTTGVQISMSRFQKVIYHPDKQTVDIGSGLIWDNVYKALEPYNVTVVGARVSVVGVAGYILGGGYSWKSSRYALGMDNVLEYELVSPNGTIVYVNNQSYPDIFFGLKGGYNNFGIVTNFNVRALPQTEVYGGILVYDRSQFDAVIQAMVDFHACNKDPKAVIIGSPLNTSAQFLFYLLAFYDAPTAPVGTFDKFLSIPHISTLQRQSYRSLIELVQSSISVKYRVRYVVVSVTNITTRLFNGIINQITYVNSRLGSKDGAFFLCDIEPYVSSYLSNSQGGAYPHPNSPAPLFPIDIQFSWLSASDDALFIDAIKSTQRAILQMVLDEGQDVGGSKQILYPNYAIDDTPLQHLYGNNVARLQHIRKVWDPKNVMYCTGGFKF